MDVKDEVWLEQYKHFRQWIADGQKQRDEATQFAITANAALAAWIFTVGRELSWPVYWLPLALTIMLGLWWYGIREKVLEAGRFVQHLERTSGLSADLKNWPGAALFGAEDDEKIDKSRNWWRKFRRFWRRDFTAWATLALLAVLFGLSGRGVAIAGESAA